MESAILSLRGVSGTAFPVIPNRVSKVIEMLRYADLNERPFQAPREDIVSLTLDVPERCRMYLSGNARQQQTFLSLLRGNVQPMSGTITQNGDVLHSANVLAFLRAQAGKAVGVVAAAFLDREGRYPFGAARNLVDILAAGALLEYAYAPVDALSEVEERVLAIVLMLNAEVNAGVFSARDFALLGPLGQSLGEQLVIRYDGRAILVVGEKSPPPWLRPTESVVLV